MKCLLESSELNLCLITVIMSSQNTGTNSFLLCMKKFFRYKILKSVYQGYLQKVYQATNGRDLLLNFTENIKIT